jgi:uncharacterized RDD family membrane protein YckC
MSEEKEIMWISGFWRRIGAFVIDSILLGLLGLLLGLVLEDFFVGIGGWGRFIGFVIAILYFGIMNSKVAGGQTIGKKALKIRVVNSDNQAISLVRSIARYSIIGIPFFLNGALIPVELTSIFWAYVLSAIVFGGLISIVYLYIFNRTTRQSLHDILVGTYVVNVNVANGGAGSIWKPHYAVVSIIFILTAMLPNILSTVVTDVPFADLARTQEAILSNSEVSYAGVTYNTRTTTTLKTGISETTYISAQVMLNNDQISNTKLARELALLILTNYSSAIDKDAIVINLVYGYDIGIASKWKSFSHSFDPRELGNKI